MHDLVGCGHYSPRCGPREADDGFGRAAMAEETADLPAAPQGAVSSWATVGGALRQDVLRKFGNPPMLLFVTSLLPKFTSAVPALAAVDLGLCTLTLLSLAGRVRRLAVEQR